MDEKEAKLKTEYEKLSEFIAKPDAYSDPEIGAKTRRHGELKLILELLAEQKQKNTELYKRLRDYFQLSSIQTHEVLASYKEDNILENLTYVEEKIRERESRVCGYSFQGVSESLCGSHCGDIQEAHAKCRNA